MNSANRPQQIGRDLRVARGCIQFGVPEQNLDHPHVDAAGSRRSRRSDGRGRWRRLVAGDLIFLDQVFGVPAGMLVGKCVVEAVACLALPGTARPRATLVAGFNQFERIG
jgi:hypothetical protein